MKFKKIIICLLLCLSLVGLTACGSSAPSLSGTYSAETFGTTMTYTFDGDSVTAQFFMAGIQIAGLEGTYELNEDSTQITLTFDPSQTENTALPPGQTTPGGTFTFQEGDGYLLIGNIRYDAVDGNASDAGQASSESQPARQTEQSGCVDASTIHLDLPDTYEIQYTVHEEYGWSNDYTESMVKCDAGYFLDFGGANERYVFERIDGGKYLMYQYDTALGTYKTPMLTADIQQLIDAGVMTEDMVAVDANVVSGYAARITADFDLYQSFSSHLCYAGKADVAGVPCQEFTASFEEVLGSQDAQVWIDPETGLCMKAEYRYQAPDGTIGVRQIECTKWETDGIALPALS